MKTFHITGPGETHFGEQPKPTPSDGEALVEIKRLGFCGSDLNTFRGANPLVSYPRIPGHEIAGVIAELGVGAPAHLKAGLPVTVLPYTNCGKCTSCRAGRPNACKDNQTFGVQREGAFTEFITVPFGKILHAPGLSLEEYALVEPLAVGFHAVWRGRVSADDTVLVLGTGMIGLGAIAAAALKQGARVIAVDIDDGKLELARKAGASETINSLTESLHQRVLELTNGDGVDVTIEAVGLPETFIAAVDEVCFAGRVVYIGYAKQPVSYETKYFVMKELDILGSRGARRRDFEDVIETLATGRYPVAETITLTVPFKESGTAMQSWSDNPSAITKIHVTLD